MTLSLWGLAAYLLLYLAVVSGTAASSPGLRKRLPMLARSSGTHTILSLAGLVAAGVHSLKGVASPQGDQWALLLFLRPDARGTGMALGIAGLYGLLFATAVVYVRRGIPPSLWRGLHALAYPAFGAAAWHSIALGANAWLPVMRVAYAATLASAALLAGGRLVELVARRRGAVALVRNVEAPLH